MGPAPHGLPRDSVLGPLLYIIYASEFLILYALLGQLMISWLTCTIWHLMTDAMAAVRAMILAAGALVAWMSSNRLRLNPSKTQYTWLSTRQQRAKLNLAAVTASFSRIAFSVTVRDLGGTLAQEVSFTPQACAFSVVGSSVWNGLPLAQRWLPSRMCLSD